MTRIHLAQIFPSRLNSCYSQVTQGLFDALFLTFSSSLFHKTLKSVAHIYPLDNKAQPSPKKKNEIALQESVLYFTQP